MQVIENIFKTYGFATATIIGIISFFCARFFSTKDKKLELRHTLFQQLKVESINNFINCYSSSELCWTQLPYYDILDHKITGKGIDELTLPTLNSLRASYYKLFVLLDEKEMIEFTEMYDSIGRINNLLSRLLFDYSDTTLVTKTNEYYSLVTDTSKVNKKLLKTIGEKFRTKYS